MDENEKNLNKIENEIITKKNNLLTIDYSKFQNIFSNDSNTKSNTRVNTETNKNYQKINVDKKNNKKANEAQRYKNLEHFLNVSGIINDIDSQSQSYLLDKENKDNKNIIITNNLTDISIGDNDETNILSGCNDLLNNNVENNKNDNNGKIKEYQKKIKNDNNNNNVNNNTFNSVKKNKYLKFLNQKSIETDNRKNCSYTKKMITKFISSKYKTNTKNNPNSYVQLIKRNNLFDSKMENKFNKKQRKNDNFYLLSETSHKINDSVTNLSEISNITPIGEINYTNSKVFSKTNNNKQNNDKFFFYRINNRKNNIVKKKSNVNKKKINSYTQKNFFNISDLNMTGKNMNIKKKKGNYREVKVIGKDKINKSQLLAIEPRKNNYLYNKYIKLEQKQAKSFNHYNDRTKNDNIMSLLDNIKDKFLNKENKYRNQQKNMKNEIDILREKLKKLSVNEALYQVEIEKLKRSNENNNNINNSKNVIENHNSNNNKLLNSNNDIKDKNFNIKLDSIIQKNSNLDNNINNNVNIKKFEQLLKIYNLDKNILIGENIDNDLDDIDYEEVLKKYPKLNSFIKILVNKYKSEKEYRIRLEEKTVDIFTNDMKMITILENKLKKYEGNKNYKINSRSLNMSYDGGLSDII